MCVEHQTSGGRERLNTKILTPQKLVSFSLNPALTESIALTAAALRQICHKFGTDLIFLPRVVAMSLRGRMISHTSLHCLAREASPCPGETAVQ